MNVPDPNSASSQSADQQPSASSSDMSTPKTLSASSKKLKSHVVKKKKKQKKRLLRDRLEVPEGNRLVDMGQLSKALLTAHVCTGGKHCKILKVTHLSVCVIVNGS